jgi:hypothetical protein
MNVVKLPHVHFAAIPVAILREVLQKLQKPMHKYKL